MRRFCLCFSFLLAVLFVAPSASAQDTLTQFSPHGCEFTVRIPGKIRPMEKQTAAGLVRGGVSEIIPKGSARKLFLQVECQQGPKFNYD